MPPLDYADKYDVAAEASDSILGTVKNFAVATGVDTVATFWNSLTPQEMNISTRDLLTKVDNNALALYDEHPDAVSTASMIAGALVPGGIAMKLLGRMRAGVTAAGYTESGIASAVRGTFTGQRQKKLELEIEQIFAKSGSDTAEYKKLTRQLYTSNAGQQVLDNAIIEVAVVGSMNAHPYMEDYLKDPMQNFAIGVGIGGVLGTAISMPMTRRTLINLTAPLETGAHVKILESGYDPIYYRDNSLSEAAAVQRHSANMKILDNIMIDDNESSLVKGIAERLRKSEGQDQANAVMRAAPWLTADKNKGWVTDDIRMSVLNILNDEKFAGVDQIQWIDLSKPGKGTVQKVEIVDLSKPKPISNVTKMEIESIENIGYGEWRIYWKGDAMPVKVAAKSEQEAAEKAGKVKPTKIDLSGADDYAGNEPKPTTSSSDKKLITTSFTTPDGKPAIAFVRPSTGETFAGNVRNVAHAVDIRTANAQIAAAGAPKQPQIFISPNAGTFESRLFQGKSAAQDDLEFLTELKRASMLATEKIPYVTIASDDLARMNAMLAHMNGMDLEQQASFKVRFRNDYPTFDVMVRKITEKVQSGGLGVAPDYIQNVQNRFNTGMKQEEVGLFNRVGHKNQASLTDWQGAPASSHVEVDILKAFTDRGPGDAAQGAELYAAGKDFRAEMRKHANPDGYVYLYRAMQQERREGQAALHRLVEGYSIYPLRKFGKPELYPVHVDSIVGMIGSPGEYIDEAEILVMAGRQKPVDPRQIAGSSVSKFTETKAEPVHIDQPPSIENITVEQLHKKYADETTRQIKELIGSKIMSFEEISARTNVTPAGVQAVAAGQELAEFPAEWRRYTNVKDIETKYLDPKNKLYAILGNPEKNPNSSAMAKLDDRSSTVMQRQTFDHMTMQSNAMIGNDANTLYNTKEMSLQLQTLRNKLAEIGNVNIGDVRYQSADQLMRNTEIGQTVTFLGKQLIDQVDKMKKRLLEPLSAAFTPFRGRPELFAEFNNVTNKLYGLSGWRDLRIDAESGFGYIVQKQSVEGKIAEVPVKNVDGTTFYVKQKEVLAAFESTRSVSNEMLKTHNLIRAMSGQSPLNDMGFYLPPTNLTGRSVAYVIDNTGKEGVQLLVANKADELESLKQAYQAAHAHDFTTGRKTINTKIEQEEWNLAKGYTDYQPYTTYASASDTALFHTGSSAQKIVPSDDRYVNNIMSGYENVIISSYRKYGEMYLNDVTGWLDKLSDYYTRNVDAQPKYGLFKEKVKDSAAVVKNVLLGRDQLEASVGLKAVNSLTDFLYNRAAAGINNVAKSFQTEQVGSKEFFESLNQTLRSKGVDSPWKSFDEYLATTTAESRNIAPKIQSAANGLLATLNLRMFEVAQAAVNVMSLPILTWSALMEKLPATSVNPQGSAIKFPLEAMMNGVKSMWGPEAKRLDEMWEAQGLLKQVTRQYTETTANLKGAGQGREFLDKAIEVSNNIQNNKWIKDVFSKPADFAEELTRKFAMHTGYRAAKQAYPGIDDTAATIAAVAFADRSIGNYHAAQRPAMFQGTFGAAIGLYQTYVLTYAQSIYRGIENQNFKQLASLALAQSGIFGISSWPGYHTLSEQVVGHLSDQHVDLTTGTYRAVSDPAARLILYGLPSSLGPAFYTRGDVSPRIPSTMGEIAVFNGVKQGWSAASQIIQKAGEGLQNGTLVQSMSEALSLQSMNRPIARWAELVSGSSVTTQLNTVTPTSEMFTPVGVASRVIGTRPVEEQVTRNAIYLNRYYEALDKERRDGAMDALATAVRNNSLDDTLVNKTAEKYLRAGGNARGWQTALNQVLLQSTEGSRLTLLRKLEPTSPLNMMIRDLY